MIRGKVRSKSNLLNELQRENSVGVTEFITPGFNQEKKISQLPWENFTKSLQGLVLVHVTNQSLQGFWFFEIDSFRFDEGRGFS